MNEADANADTQAAADTGGLLALGLTAQMPSSEAIAAALPQYDRFEPIGAGGMGVVWRARQIQLERTVAIKLLRPELAADPSFAERFAREARALARLQHPNIVGVHDYGEVLGLFYLVMEHVDGTDLRTLLGSGLTSEQALAIVPQLCDALQYAHEEGVVHRDIKPENILVDRRGRVRIADFGLAKLKDTQASRATSSGRVMGTAHYMAPEQIDRPGEVDHRADIFALGVVLYEMLTGKLPIGRFEMPSRLRAVDVRLDDVVMKALEHDRELRYQHVSEVKDRVIALGPADRVRPEPDEVERRVAAERKRSMRVGVAIMVVVFGAILVNGVYYEGRPGGFQLGYRAGYHFDSRVVWWLVLGSMLSGYPRMLYSAIRDRGTPRGWAMEAKLAMGMVYAAVAFGLYFAAAKVSPEFVGGRWANVTACLLVALLVFYAIWAQATERGVPMRIVLGHTWWVTRWEAEQAPRGPATRNS
jgi:protein kinase-like protein